MRREHLVGFGSICLNSALALQSSWVVTLCALEGMSWATPVVAGAVHWVALGFAFGSPLGFGAMLWAKAPPAERGDAMKAWFARCFLPLALYAAALRAAVMIVPSLSVGLVLALMAGTVPLGLYGILLRHEALSGD